MDYHEDGDNYEQYISDRSSSIVGPRASGGRGIIDATRRYIDQSKEVCQPRSYTQALQEGFHLEPSVNCVDLNQQLRLESQLHGMAYWLPGPGPFGNNSDSYLSTSDSMQRLPYETSQVRNSRTPVMDSQHVDFVYAHGNHVRNFNDALERYGRHISLC